VGIGSLTSCPGRVNQSNLMLRRDSPVPGNDTDARTPDSLALSVTWNGPSLIDLVNDLIPCSVILNPAIVRSKLIGDLEFATNFFPHLLDKFTFILSKLRIDVLN
jgi:hypothetical protein